MRFHHDGTGRTRSNYASEVIAEIQKLPLWVDLEQVEAVTGIPPDTIMWMSKEPGHSCPPLERPKKSRKWRMRRELLLAWVLGWERSDSIESVSESSANPEHAVEGEDDGASFGAA